MKRIFLVIWLLMFIVQLSSGQTAPSSPPVPKARGPVKILKFGKKRGGFFNGLFGSLSIYQDPGNYDYSFQYHENPDTVTAYAYFFLVGSYWTSLSKDSVSINFSFYNAGKKLIPPSSVEVGIYTRTRYDGCLYKNNHDLAFNIDNNLPESVDLSPKVLDDRGQSCYEIYNGRMSYELFSKLAKAQKVSVKLGSKLIKLKNGDLKIIQGVNNGIGVY